MVAKEVVDPRFVDQVDIIEDIGVGSAWEGGGGVAVNSHVENLDH